MAETEMKYPGRDVQISLTRSERITDAGREIVLAQIRKAFEIGAITVEEYQQRLDFVMDSLTKARAEKVLEDLPMREVSVSVLSLSPPRKRISPAARAVLKSAAMIPLGAIPFLCVILTVGPDPASNTGHVASASTALIALYWICIWACVTAFTWRDRKENR